MAAGSENRNEARMPAAWKALAWAGLGLVLGAALAAAFIAYGQPGLLLEQMNLRYCG